MTFRQWATANNLGDLPDVVYRYAEVGWQAAQTEERKRSEDLVAALREIVEEDDRFAIPGNPVGGIARAAIAKYEESR